MAKNKYYILALVLVILAVVLFLFRTPDKKGKKSVPNEISPSKNNTLDTIEKDKNSEDKFSTEMSYSFLIEPEYEEKISFKISGKLEAFSWKRGDKFKKGDLLFQLDNTALFEQIIEAKKQLKIDIDENLTQIQDENFKQKWQNFSAQIKENDLLPEVPSFYSKGYQEIQITNKVISDIRNIQSLESQIFDYFYLAPFDGEFKEFNVKTSKNINSKQKIAIIYPSKFAVLKTVLHPDQVRGFKHLYCEQNKNGYKFKKKQNSDSIEATKKVRYNSISPAKFFDRSQTIIFID